MLVLRALTSIPRVVISKLLILLTRNINKSYSAARPLNTLPLFWDASHVLKMIYLPPLRRLLLPATIFLAIVVFYRSSFSTTSLPSFILHPPPPPSEGIRVPFTDVQPEVFPAFDAAAHHLIPSTNFYYDLYESSNGSISTWSSQKPIDQPALNILWQCPVQANRYTNHIRIPAIVRNITQIPPEPLKPENRVFWNPTIISLPYWAENQYLVVSRIVTAGNHQENVMCEANVCYVGPAEDAKPREKPCTEDDLKLLGPAGGMRCASTPIALNVPPTPAEQCYGKYGSYVDVPGFHDPRIFWSGKGEPLMMVNTQYVEGDILPSMYADVVAGPGTPASASGCSTSEAYIHPCKTSSPPLHNTHPLARSNHTLASPSSPATLPQPGPISKRTGFSSSPQQANLTSTTISPTPATPLPAAAPSPNCSATASQPPI